MKHILEWVLQFLSKGNMFLQNMCIQELLPVTFANTYQLYWEELKKW